MSQDQDYVTQVLPNEQETLEYETKLNKVYEERLKKLSELNKEMNNFYTSILSDDFSNKLSSFINNSLSQVSAIQQPTIENIPTSEPKILQSAQEVAKSLTQLIEATPTTKRGGFKELDVEDEFK